MTTWTEHHAPKPGDLIYYRDPGTGEVFTDQAWVVLDNDGSVPAEHLAPSMPWKTYWEVRVQCDGRCTELGVDGCSGGPQAHCWLLSADDFVLVSRLPEFEVRR